MLEEYTLRFFTHLAALGGKKGQTGGFFVQFFTLARLFAGFARNG